MKSLVGRWLFLRRQQSGKAESPSWAEAKLDFGGTEVPGDAQLRWWAGVI